MDRNFVFAGQKRYGLVETMEKQEEQENFVCCMFD